MRCRKNFLKGAKDRVYFKMVFDELLDFLLRESLFF